VAICLELNDVLWLAMYTTVPKLAIYTADPNLNPCTPNLPCSICTFWHDVLWVRHACIQLWCCYAHG